MPLKPLPPEGVDLLEQNQPASAVGLMTLDNFSDGKAMCLPRIFQMSALSTIDGRILAYHGYNG